jgi:ATP-binding cassette subfamily B protein
MAIWRWIAGLAVTVTSCFTLAAVMVLLLTLDPTLALIGLSTVPVAAYLAFRHAAAQARGAHGAASSVGDYTSVIESAVSGARTVKGLGAEPTVLQRAHAASATVQAEMLHLARLEASWFAWAAVIPALGIAAGLWFGGNQVLDGSISVGTLVAFAGWMSMLVTASTTLTQCLADRGVARAAATRIAEVLGDAPTTRVVQPAPTLPRGDVVAAGVVARRGDRQVLHGVDLQVEAGEWLAVVGVTGSGKSTLLRLLAGLDLPVGGQVRVGGVDPAGAAPGSGGVVLVAQGASLLSGSLREVLQLASPGATDDELRTALHAAGADDVVHAVGGLDGPVGEGGRTLSGGQRQRLALTAAVLRRPRVLLLDDTTSALDPTTEAAVLGALRPHLPGTTTVIATHRHTTAVACDRAVLLADGRLVTPGAGDLEQVLGPSGGGVR